MTIILFLLAVIFPQDPLDGKNFGIELSPLYSMFVSDGLSGSFSSFNLSDAEVAFPFSHRKYRRNNTEGEIEYRYLTYLDAQYRLFLGKHRIGKWIGTGLRFCLDEDSEGSYNKGGISFGFGTRIFSEKGWYWGSSLYLGKYYFGEKDRGDSSFLQVELLKFGFAF